MPARPRFNAASASSHTAPVVTAGGGPIGAAPGAQLDPATRVSINSAVLAGRHLVCMMLVCTPHHLVATWADAPDPGFMPQRISIAPCQGLLCRIDPANTETMRSAA